MNNLRYIFIPYRNKKAFNGEETILFIRTTGVQLNEFILHKKKTF